MNRVNFVFGLIFVAAGAAAFAPTHVVVADDAVVYDENHQYDDAYVVARPPYWTAARCEAVGSPSSPRTYCYVTLTDGTTGLAEWDYFGKLYVAAREARLRAAPGDDQAEVGRVAVGESIAEVGPPVFLQPPGFHDEHYGDATGIFYDEAAEEWREVMTKDRRRGFLRAADLTAAD